LHEAADLVGILCPDHEMDVIARHRVIQPTPCFTSGHPLVTLAWIEIIFPEMTQTTAEKGRDMSWDLKSVESNTE
jgi:hypothetical protein